MVLATISVISLALMGLGIALKKELLLLASTVSWIIFAFLAFSYVFDNTAINTGLLLFGGAMAIICAIMFINAIMSRRPRRVSSEDDQESYRKKVLKTTRRK